jgi:2,4-dienoyl-CoA reductase-like NADH-dependent reductase (Old Yellow Enzyme family)
VLHADVAQDDQIRDLFTPLSVKSLTVRNRFAMAPMTRRASPGGVPGEDVAAYYARRAAGGVGLIITEGVRIPHAAAGWPASIPALAGQDVLQGWRAVTAGVHAGGATIAAQLWHQGAQRDVHDGDTPEQLPVSPSGRDTLGAPVGRALRSDELDAVAQSYALAARNAKTAGFDAVELHGAHGYLLDEFLWHKTNLRTDGYGGSISARTRFPVEVIAAVRAAVGAHFPIIYRFSQWKANQYDARIASNPAELEALLAPLVDAGVDVFHPSTRRHWLPAFTDGVGADAELSLPGWTKKISGLPVIAVGSVGLAVEFKPSSADGSIPSAPVDRLLSHFADGEFDMIAVGRALLADPAWVNRLRDGALGEFTGYDPATALAGLR